MRDDLRSVMLFAAGFGTRMGALTADRPKPLVEVGGKPLIDHALELVEAYGATTIVANLHYKPEMLEAYLLGRNIRYSRELPDILETGGGLRAALPLLAPGPQFTMNTDAVWQGANPLSHLSALWNPKNMDALLLCIPRDNAIGHEGPGDFLLGQDGQITRGPGLVYSGVQIIKTDLLDSIRAKSFSLNLLWDEMLKQNRLYGAAYDGKWCDVGRPEGIALAEDMLKSHDV